MRYACLYFLDKYLTDELTLIDYGSLVGNTYSYMHVNFLSGYQAKSNAIDPSMLSCHNDPWDYEALSIDQVSFTITRYQKSKRATHADFSSFPLH